MLRRLAERLNRNVVIQRRLPARYGAAPIYVSPDSALQFLKWDFEGTFAYLFRWVDEHVKPGAVVWDVGANVGCFTFAAAAAAGPTGRVIALEPDTFLLETLTKTLRAPSPPRAEVSILPVAASSSADIAAFSIAARGRSCNHLASSQGGEDAGGVRYQTHVMTVTLDWLMERFPAPDVLKIDVEGAEIEALRGARRLLVEAQPIVLCEVFEEHSAEATEILRAAGYVLFDAESADRTELAAAAYNTLAVPRSRMASARAA